MNVLLCDMASELLQFRGMFKPHSRLLMFLLAGVAAANLGCSGNAGVSPSGPSAVPSLPSGINSATGVLSSTAVNGSPSRPDKPHGPKVGGEGTVASLHGDCPTVSMVVRGVHVTTTNETTYEIGACENLRPGTKVVVEGEFQADGSLTATSIVITDQPGGHPVAGEGTVGSLRGDCPILTMVVHGYPVMTTSDTTFSDGTCADIRPGSRIRVSGDIFGNSVLASEVTLLPAVQ